MTPLLLAIAASVTMGPQAAPYPAPPLAALIATGAQGAPFWGTQIAQQGPKQAAPASISSDVIVLHGTNDGSGIDPKIGKMPALGKPPFSSYNSYKMLDQTKLGLAKGKGSSYKLPTGRELSIVYKDVTQPAKAGDPVRFVVTASIQKQDGKTFLPLLEVNAKAGEWFFVGGQEYKGGGLVIGIKVSP